MGRRIALGAIATMLTFIGLVGLARHQPATDSRATRVPTVGVGTPTTGGSTSTSASVGGKTVARPEPSPEDTWPPVSVSIPVEEPSPLTDVTVAAPVEEPTCSTSDLTVIAIEGCPNSSSVIGAVVAATQGATGATQKTAALPQ